VPAEVPLVLEEKQLEAGEADLVPAEEPPVPTKMQLEATEADLVPADVPPVPEEKQLEAAEAELGPAEVPPVPVERQLEAAEADLVPAEVPPVPEENQLEVAEADLVPTGADQGPAEVRLEAAEADLVPAKAPLVSTRARLADTVHNRTPLAVTEGSGLVLPSKQEAGVSAVHAEATRHVKGVEASTSHWRHAGMPAAAGKKPMEPRGTAPGPSRKRCNATGQTRRGKPAVPQEQEVSESRG
jgi:hypothetical protein